MALQVVGLSRKVHKTTQNVFEWTIQVLKMTPFKNYDQCQWLRKPDCSSVHNRDGDVKYIIYMDNESRAGL